MYAMVGASGKNVGGSKKISGSKRAGRRGFSGVSGSFSFSFSGVPFPFLAGHDHSAGRPKCESELYKLF